MIKYGIIFIDDVKVVVGSDGSCNLRKYNNTFAGKISKNNKKGHKSGYAVKINGKFYRLHRIMAKVFLDPEVVIRKNEGDPCNYDYNHRIIFVNDNPFDLRLENIRIVDQQYNVTRKNKEEDKLHLIDMTGKIIDTGTMNELQDKYSVNRGCLRDVALGNNKSLTISKFPKQKFITIRVRDYSKEAVDAKIKEAKNAKSIGSGIDYSKGILQIDVNGNFKLRSIDNIKSEFDKNPAGLYMVLQGKRSSWCGYVWVAYVEYKKNPDICKQRLLKALSHGLSAKNLVAFPDEI